MKSLSCWCISLWNNTVVFLTLWKIFVSWITEIGGVRKIKKKREKARKGEKKRERRVKREKARKGEKKREKNKRKRDKTRKGDKKRERARKVEKRLERDRNREKNEEWKKRERKNAKDRKKNKKNAMQWRGHVHRSEMCNICVSSVIISCDDYTFHLFLRQTGALKIHSNALRHYSIAIG